VHWFGKQIDCSRIKKEEKVRYGYSIASFGSRTAPESTNKKNCAMEIAWPLLEGVVLQTECSHVHWLTRGPLSKANLLAS